MKFSYVFTYCIYWFFYTVINHQINRTSVVEPWSLQTGIWQKYILEYDIPNQKSLLIRHESKSMNRCFQKFLFSISHALNYYLIFSYVYKYFITPNQKNFGIKRRENNGQTTLQIGHFKMWFSRVFTNPRQSSVISNDWSRYGVFDSLSCKVRSYTRVWFLLLTLVQQA